MYINRPSYIFIHALFASDCFLSAIHISHPPASPNYLSFCIYRVDSPQCFLLLSSFTTDMHPILLGLSLAFAYVGIVVASVIYMIIKTIIQERKSPLKNLPGPPNPSFIKVYSNLGLWYSTIQALSCTKGHGHFCSLPYISSAKNSSIIC